VARERDDHQRAQRWEDAARGWKDALQSHAWDGQWYKRAFFDDGSALGSHANAECRIDLIAQAWSVLSDAAPPAFQRIALASMDEQLVGRDTGLVKLLTPALATQQPSAGYIQAYPKGVRENGGQYSHAGVWALMAQARAGHGDVAYRYFVGLSPAHRSQHPTLGGAYAIEPYVMAGDVYTEAPYVGRGGWSWYTGSAAWMHRAAIESMFGLKQRATTLWFEPCLPSHWDRAELRLRRGNRQWRFIFLRGDAAVVSKVLDAESAASLAPGETLNWQVDAAPDCFVLALGAATTAARALAGETAPH